MASRSQANPGTQTDFPDPSRHEGRHSPSAPLHDGPVAPSASRPQPPHGGSEIISSCRCPPGSRGRNLVVCIDGTANQFGNKNTNVIELYSLIKKDRQDEQRTWYNSGIGTYARPSYKSWTYYKHVIGHTLDLAIAWNFESIVMDAYRWLSETFEDGMGDRIFLFGFSRGAYQVRTLSAMIEKVGLIHRGNEKQIPFAYELYANPRSGDSPVIGSDGASKPAAGRFKETFSRTVNVHFVGAWDTVSSIGIQRGKDLLPGTTDGMKHVCFFRHALALDERRVKFLPEYAYGGTSRPIGEDAGNSDSSHTKEVWFAGTHSDIGGGNEENPHLDRTLPSLRWMYYEASAAGLRLKFFKRKLDVNDGITIKESLRYFWWLAEYLPLRRLSYTKDEEGKHTTYCKPHHFKATLPPKEFWKLLRETEDHHAELDRWKEPPNLYDLVLDLVVAYTSAKRTHNDRRLLAGIREKTGSSDGQRALCQTILQLLQSKENVSPARFCPILHVLLESDIRFRMTMGTYQDLREVLLHQMQGASEDEYQIAQRFLAMFADLEASKTLSGHSSQFTVASPASLSTIAVCFLPDRDEIVSTYYNRDIHAWDATGGLQLPKQRGNRPKDHADLLAFSNDGRLLVSTSNHQIDIMEVETGNTIMGPLKAHEDEITCVAFSNDAKRVVSASFDKTIRVWRVVGDKGTENTFKRHTASVLAAAFASGGKHVISASDDRTVLLWDASTFEELGRPFKNGHAGPVHCIAVSSTGKIATGSWDKTVRVWDAEMEQTVGVFRGNAFVLCLAFSPSADYIAVGYEDGCLRIWDVEREQEVVESRKLDAPITSCAFSPDGKRIVSGSSDLTIRIWDFILLKD